MLALIRLFIGVLCASLAWACFKVAFINVPEAGPWDKSPGYIVQAWHESPVCTIVASTFVLMCGG